MKITNKIFIAGLAFTLSSAALAEYNTGSIPTTFDQVMELKPTSGDEDSCEKQINEGVEGLYCVLSSYNKSSKDIFVEAYVLLDKESGFDSAQKIFDHYLSVDKWPEYVAKSGSNAISEFTTSQWLYYRDNGDGTKSGAHYYSYKGKAPILGYVPVSGTATYTTHAVPAAGAELSASFKCTKEWGGDWELETPTPNGEKQRGSLGQDANFHIVDLNDDGYYLLIYRTRVRSTVPILTNLAAKSVLGAVDALMLGMFFK